MASTAKSNAESAGAAATADAPFAQMVQRGVERVAEAHKRMLDIAAQQNTVAMGVVREGLKSLGSTQAAALAEGAEQAVGRVVEAQKRILDLAVQQSGAAVSAAEFAGSRLISGIAETVQQGIEAVAAAHNVILDIAVQQHGAYTDAAIKHLGPLASGPGASLAGAVRHGLTSLLEVQKTSVDVLARQGAGACRIISGTKPPASVRDLSEMARKWMDVVVDTHVQLADAVSQGAAKAAKASTE